MTNKINKTEIEEFWVNYGCCCDGEGNYFHSDDGEDKRYDNKYANFTKDFKALISSKMKELLPDNPYNINGVSQQKLIIASAGFDHCLNISNQRINDYMKGGK